MFIILGIIVGGGCFLAGYYSRYLFSSDYDRGYCDGYEYARNIIKKFINENKQN